MTAPISVDNATVRAAIATDAGWAAPLMFAAGPALFSYVFASPPDQAEEILYQAFQYPQHAFSYDHAQVVEIDDQPVGLIVSYSGEVKRQAEEKVHAVMARILPLRKLPRILVNLADLSRIKQDVELDAYYVLGISIDPDFQNHGLGTALLEQVEAEARDQNCRSICLDVTYSNTRAKELFDRMGYRITCSKTSHRFEQFTRAGGIHRMSKLL